MDLRPALIQRLNSAATPAEPDDTDETSAAPAATIPAQPVRGGGRLPNWWEPKRDVVDLDDVAKDAPEEGPCEHPHPHAVHASLTGELVAYWCEDCEAQLPVPDGMEDGDEEDEEDGEEGVDKVPARIRRGSGKRVYSRPTYNRGKSPKNSLIEAWTGMRPLTRHGLYKGGALALGFSLGVPHSSLPRRPPTWRRRTTR
ncbi:hypothetical protein ACFRCW_44710 [Streptomyces sp. NPDC056653]|uniref:hypothetical protein n=1 Tax=Streptomyces sp. NPDC056653 TaxID=3345894 RepID=UPI00367938F3